MSRIASTAIVAWTLAACTTPPLLPNLPVQVSAERVGPYDKREVCADTRIGDRVDYRFEASEPVMFSIGYREGGATLLPWNRGPTTTDSGIFPVLYAQRYCLMWQAGGAGAMLDYRVVVHRAVP